MFIGALKKIGQYVLTKLIELAGDSILNEMLDRFDEFLNLLRQFEYYIW